MMKRLKSLMLLICLLTFSSTGWALTRAEFSFNFGPSLEQSGDIEKLGDPNINTGFEFNYFFSDLHGLGVSYSNEFEFDGSSDIPRLDGGSISVFDVHYAFRLPLSDSFQMLFTPGFGFQTLYEETGDYYWGYVYQDDLSHAWVFDYKIMARFFLGSSFFLGGGFMQIFSIDDNYKGEDISGNRMSMIFQAGFGY